MKRNIEPEFEFQKENFIKLWKRAIGDRSYSAFGKEAGISFGYISKYMNGKCDVAPTIPTIKKIANAAKDVTYAELLEAAGYDSEKYCDDTVEEITISCTEWSPMNALLPTLSKANFNWRFVDPVGIDGGPISINVEDSPFDMWYFIPITRETITKEDVSAVLGSDRANKIMPGSKVTFLTASYGVFEEISGIELNLISLRISGAYIDPKDGVVSKENYVKTALEITSLDKKFMLTNYVSDKIGPLSI